MTHSEFVSAHRAGTLRVTIDPERAAKYLSARLLLPLMMLPVLGTGVALALMQMVWLGLSVIALGIVVPRVIKRSAPQFLLVQALRDEKVYLELVDARLLVVEAKSPRE